MTDEKSVAVRGFISYTRKDNEDYTGVVDHLKQSLEGRFHATTGRQLDIFVDRDSIGWGQDWRARIRESVQSATFFIPVITMRYFESKACREELLAFHEYAKELNVEALILPLVLAGADQISADDPRDDVQMIERLNYKNIEAPWLAGYSSPEWSRAIHGMVGALKKNLELAESALAVLEDAAAEKTGKAEAVGDDVDGELSDFSALTTDLEAMTQSMPRVQSAVEGFVSATKAVSGTALSNLPPAQRQAALVRVAHQLRGPAEDMSVAGGELEQRALRADARLRAVADELRSIDAPMAEEQLGKLLGSVSGMADLEKMVAQLGNLVQVLRFAAVTNVTMRRSLQPAIAGLQSLTNAIGTIRSWRQI